MRSKLYGLDLDLLIVLYYYCNLHILREVGVHFRPTYLNPQCSCLLYFPLEVTVKFSKILNRNA